MYSYGKQPYETMTGKDTVQFIEDGNRLPRPEMAELEVGTAIVVVACPDIVLSGVQHDDVVLGVRPGE